MRPAARSAITAGSILLVVVVALAWRSLSAWGVFTSVTPAFNGTCVAVHGVQGPEDIVIDESSGIAFISAMDRRAFAAGHPAKQDGVYALSLRDPAHKLVRLPGTPADFHPHGLSLYSAPDGKLTLFAVNHRANGTNAISIFGVAIDSGGKIALKETGSVAGGQLVSPNAIAAVDDQRFYVTNDHGSTTALGRWLEDIFLLPRGNVLYFDGMVFRTVAERLAFPSGAVVSHDGRNLFVTDGNNRRIVSYARNPLSGSLDEVSSLDLPSILDNVRLGEDGALLVGGHPKAFAMSAFRDDPRQPAPSQIFRVQTNGGTLVSYDIVYANNGDQIGGASVGAVSGNTLLIGSPLDNHVLLCSMKS